MVKYCLDKYPKGTFKGQRSDGKYMDLALYSSLELLADKIVKDMTFMAIIYSSTLEVGTGKSVLATQIGEAWTEIVNKKYNLDIPYNVDNIVWRPKDLIERSFKMPKYSFILLDEWEDNNYWSEVGMTLRQFFRKCRQLNLFMMIIIPNWFQMPLSYAISRSIFAIDVRFDDNLDRGDFYYYNFPAKRNLYVNGKRNHNYQCAKYSFRGYFPDGYGVDEVEYRKRKYEDMLQYEKENPEKVTKSQIETAKSIEIFWKIKNYFPNMLDTEIAEMLKVSPRTITRWKSGDVDDRQQLQANYINNEVKNKIISVDEEKMERLDKEKEGIIYDGEEE